MEMHSDWLSRFPFNSKQHTSWIWQTGTHSPSRPYRKHHQTNIESHVLLPYLSAIIGTKQPKVNQSPQQWRGRQICIRICRFLVVVNIFQLETCMNSLVKESSNLVSRAYHLHYCTGKQNYLLSNILRFALKICF
jgi:hypothetical protein